MEKVIYYFPANYNRESEVFEVVTNEGDNLYWANCNGGIAVNLDDICAILNGADKDTIMQKVWNSIFN